MATDPKKFVVPGVAVVVFAVLMVLSNQGPTKTPDGLMIIRNPEQYGLALEEARKLTQDVFVASDQMIELSDKQREDLRKGAALFDAMNAFAPDKLGPYVASGKAYQILGEFEQAVPRLRQAVSNRRSDASEEARLTAIEAQYLLSLCYLGMAQYEDALKEATEAVAAIPNSVNYRWARASALTQLKRIPEAKKEIDAALNLDPNDKRAQALEKLLLSAGSR